MKSIAFVVQRVSLLQFSQQTNILLLAKGFDPVKVVSRYDDLISLFPYLQTFGYAHSQSFVQGGDARGAF